MSARSIRRALVVGLALLLTFASPAAAGFSVSGKRVYNGVSSAQLFLTVPGGGDAQVTLNVTAPCMYAVTAIVGYTFKGNPAGTDSASTTLACRSSWTKTWPLRHFGAGKLLAYAYVHVLVVPAPGFPSEYDLYPKVSATLY
jgi:hypothetical protein